MVQMEVGDEEKVNLVCLDHVYKRKGIHTSQSWVDSTIQHDLLVLELDNVAGSSNLSEIFVIKIKDLQTNLLSRSKRSDLHQIRVLIRRVCFSRHD